MRIMLFCCLLGALATAPATAQIVSFTRHSAQAEAFDGLLSNSDLIAGQIATELPGDNGWHPANPASGNSLNPNGLPAFTDGAGAISNLTGLLNDFPSSGSPTKVINYDFATPQDIGWIRVLSGNRLDADGRVFMTAAIFSFDLVTPGNPLGLLGYFQSDPSGTINNVGQPPPGGPWKSTLVDIVDKGGNLLIENCSNLEIWFFAVDNTQGQMRDPFDGDNFFTGFDDGLTAAISSPLIWEIDVLAAAYIPGDGNFDGQVTGADFTIWADGFGNSSGNATPQDGDYNCDGVVTGADFTVWADNFGAGRGATVPEPSSFAWMVGASAGAWLARRRAVLRARGL